MPQIAGFRAQRVTSLSPESWLQVNSIEEADRKIDELAAGGMLSPALLLTMAKAYAGVKETDLTKEEVKDIMAHLYFKVTQGPETFQHST